MPVTRRNFLKLSGLTAAGSMLGGVFSFIGCKKGLEKLKGTKKTITICPLCSVGCGIVVSTRRGVVINIEGDRKNPINRGSLCIKGSDLLQVINDPDKTRLNKVLYRKAGGKNWQEIGLNEAVEKISKNIKKTRDATFIQKENGIDVNRTDSIAVLTGSTLNNEDCYLWSKLTRILGILSIENENSFLSNRADMALSETFGHHGMSNHWSDLKNSNTIMAIGCNPAENHTLSTRHIQAALNNGCKLISVDPRYTRTSALSDLYLPIRPGTDIVFINGMINYALNNNRIHREYVVEYTNASLLINSSYEFNDGIFSGFDNKKKNYDNVTWSYQIDAKGIPKRDKTLANSFSVFQILKKHVSRYTPKKVSEITGCSVESFVNTAELFTSSYAAGKAASILYSSGVTQHTTGVQTVRALAILQLILGNIGIAGGGINCIYKGPNGLGEMDHGLQTGLLPGYLKTSLNTGNSDLSSYLKYIAPVTNDPMSVNFWGIDGAQKGGSRIKKIFISLLKAWFGNAANEKNEYCYNWLPKSDERPRGEQIFKKIKDGTVKGAVLVGADPLSKFFDSDKGIEIFEKLDWLVCSDFRKNITSEFWKMKGPGNNTEVFLLPMTISIEREGSYTNSGRWVQWSSMVRKPDSKILSPLALADRLYRNVKKIYQVEGGIFPDPVLKANWDYSNKLPGNMVDPLMVAKEINGYNVKTGKSLKDINSLSDDGSTACGNWLYIGSYINGVNMMARRGLKDFPGSPGSFPEWSWSRPSNRRILYNSAGVNLKGKPWGNKGGAIKWNGDRWTGDVPDHKNIPGSKNPFIMNQEGLARIFVPELDSGPLPEHYEPVDGAIINKINSQQINPILNILDNDKKAYKKNIDYPYIGTIYSTAEYSSTSILSTGFSWLKELAPDSYCEISPTLAEKLELNTGDSVILKNEYGTMSTHVFVTERIKAWKINDDTHEMVGIVSRSGAHKLVHEMVDPDSGIREFKSFLINIEKGQ